MFDISFHGVVTLVLTITAKCRPSFEMCVGFSNTEDISANKIDFKGSNFLPR